MLRQLSHMIWCWCHGTLRFEWSQWGPMWSLACAGAGGHNSHDGGKAVRVILELRSPTARADHEVEQQIYLATFTYLYLPVSVSVLAVPGLQPPVHAYGLGAWRLMRSKTTR